MSNCVLNDGTYNVDKFEIWRDSAVASLEMYGTQDVKVKLDIFKPARVQSSTASLTVNSTEWDEHPNMLVMSVTATDVQGVKSDIVIISETIADFNGDRLVDFDDFGILASQWTEAGSTPSADIAPVPGGDSMVDMIDLAVFAEHWLGP